MVAAATIQIIKIASVGNLPGTLSHLKLIVINGTIVCT